MGEHADFIAHLLDPEENALIQKAMQTSQRFPADAQERALVEGAG